MKSRIEPEAYGLFGIWHLEKMTKYNSLGKMCEFHYNLFMISLDAQGTLQFADLSHEAAFQELGRFNRLDAKEHPDFLTLGKVLTWCLQFKKNGPIQKFMREHYGVEGLIHTHIYRCAKVFRFFLKHSILESEYDKLTLNQALKLSKMIPGISKEELVQKLKSGIDGRIRRKRVSKIPGLPNYGWIYVAVTSTDPFIVKLGKTQKLPEDRARDLGNAGATKRLVMVWFAEVIDCVKAERAMHAPFVRLRVPGKRDWFQIPPKMGVEQAFEIGKLFSVPATPVPK